MKPDIRIIDGRDTTFRIEDCELTPDDAHEHLVVWCGFSPAEANAYLDSIPTEDFSSPRLGKRLRREAT